MRVYSRDRKKWKEEEKRVKKRECKGRRVREGRKEGERVSEERRRESDEVGRKGRENGEHYIVSSSLKRIFEGRAICSAICVKEHLPDFLQHRNCSYRVGQQECGISQNQEHGQALCMDGK